MAAPHHLSYPFIIEHEGQIYMLPEAYESGRLTLYRAKEFPGGWEPVCDLLDQPAIDASVTHHNGLWWMFYTLPGPNRHAESALYVASAMNAIVILAPFGLWGLDSWRLVTTYQTKNNTQKKDTLKKVHTKTQHTKSKPYNHF
jgi:hypothetical protein